jgi:formylglycine-generating enzyme
MRLTFLLPVLVLLEGCSSSQEKKTTTSVIPRNEIPTAEMTAPEGMVWIPGGEFTMGTDDPQAYAYERPAHRVRIDGFWMDVSEVTNAQFRSFADATGYVTIAEKKPEWEELRKQLPPGTQKPADNVFSPGSLTFTPPSYAVSLDDYSQWWTWTNGASWKHPEGPGSTLEGKGNYPVVHVAYDDAVAYCTWAGKRLPTEAEWEFASRGGREGQRYSWGSDFKLGGKFMANTFQGVFPGKDTGEDGFAGSSPVRTFPPNDYGLYDIIGNCWEWTLDTYHVSYYDELAKAGLAVNPTGAATAYDPSEPYARKYVTRGGSFLCSENYCANYRPSARQGSAFDSGMSHISFRCVSTPSVIHPK